MSDIPCKDRVKEAYESTRSDLTALLELNREDSEAYHDDLGHLNDYGLSFEYVPPDEDNFGYYRYLMSWGGPSDEIRFVVGASHEIIFVEYWLLDWFDGASITADHRGHGDHLNLTDEAWLVELWDWFEPARRVVFEEGCHEWELGHPANPYSEGV